MTSQHLSNGSTATVATPQRVRAALRAWFGLIVVGTVLGAIVGYGVATITPPTYSSSVTLLVAPKSSPDNASNVDSIQIAQALAPTFAELATTGPILRSAIASTGVDVNQTELAESIKTQVPAGTSLLTITVALPDAGDAAAVASAIALELKGFVPRGAAGAISTLQVELDVVDPAVTATVPDGPGVLVRTALGGAIGLFMTLCFVFLIENIWPQNRSEAGLEPPAGQSALSAAGPRAASPAWPTDPARMGAAGPDHGSSRTS